MDIMYIKTHTYSIYFENICMYLHIYIHIHIIYIMYACVCIYIYIRNIHSTHTYIMYTKTYFGCD